MKLPNFRLYDTQATASMILGLFGLLCAAVLVFVVFRGFDTEHMAVVYDPQGTMGQFRRPLVFITTAISMVAGGVAGIVGFSSLGQKRNTKQGRSWLGMALGAVTIAMAPVLFLAWFTFSEPLIRDHGG